MTTRDEFVKAIGKELGDALESIDNAIAIRDEGEFIDLRDLDLLRAEIHAITCRPGFQRVK